jgi:hypothetical protein
MLFDVLGDCKYSQKLRYISVTILLIELATANWIKRPVFTLVQIITNST